MAAKGRSDLRMLLRPAGENICLNRPAGLKRSNFSDRASGAKTKPPCAKPTASETASAATWMGKTQRMASTLVQKRSEPLASMESEPAESRVLRKKSVQ